MALTNPILAATQKAVRANLSVVPPAEDGTKRPRTVGGRWDQFKSTRPTLEQLQAWFPGAQGIGIIAGDVSGGVECWDFDDRETYRSFLEVAEAAGMFSIVERIEDGYADDTPGGGVRWLVRVPRGSRRDHNSKLARRLKHPEEQQHPQDKVKVLIELPDYAIVAPTSGRVHPSGRAYQRRQGDFDTIATITAEEREALIGLARSFDAMPQDVGSTATPTSRDRRGSRPGDDFNARTSWNELLEPQGWTPVFTRGETTFWRRPGKRFGISATTNHAGSDLLWVFSSSTVFEQDRSYDRFGAYAVVEHHGDLAVAARTLAAKGYGTTEQPGPPGATGPGGDGQDGHGVQLEDFYAYMPMHSYIFAPSRELWPASSVNARLASVTLDGSVVKAAAWLDQHSSVEQMTWIPGQPMLIRDRLVSDGGWIDRPGCTTFNLYRPPTVTRGDAQQVGPWLEHVRRIYPTNADHIVAWLAHRVQQPADKINHALVLGGAQGIGKDTLLEPIKHAVGPWNFVEVSPSHLLGRFNGFVKSVILRISEARDLGEVDRYSFYDHLKIYTAAPPDVLRVDEKNLREYPVWNVCGVVITTNHRTDGLYLPADDRRHYVAWSEATKESFTPEYWGQLYSWYQQGGVGHVSAYLAELDLSAFNPKAPPPKTAAFWDVVDANRAPEDAELADALDRLGDPEALTLDDVAGPVPSPFSDWLKDRKNARQVPHRLEAAGYVAMRNPDATDGLWRIGGRRQVVYVRHGLTPRDRVVAARQRVADR